MTPPALLKISHHDWRVRPGRVKAPEGEFWYGVTRRKKTRIDFDDTVSPSQQRDTLLHEVLHAILTDSPFRLSNDDEERAIRAVTPGLLAALRDNPDLVKFLLED